MSCPHPFFFEHKGCVIPMAAKEASGLFELSTWSGGRLSRRSTTSSRCIQGSPSCRDGNQASICTACASLRNTLLGCGPAYICCERRELPGELPSSTELELEPDKTRLRRNLPEWSLQDD
eukprot:g20985.t1